jgi:hypothetical protein
MYLFISSCKASNLSATRWTRLNLPPCCYYQCTRYRNLDYSNNNWAQSCRDRSLVGRDDNTTISTRSGWFSCEGMAVTLEVGQCKLWCVMGRADIYHDAYKWICEVCEYDCRQQRRGKDATNLERRIRRCGNDAFIRVVILFLTKNRTGNRFNRIGKCSIGRVGMGREMGLRGAIGSPNSCYGG